MKPEAPVNGARLGLDPRGARAFCRRTTDGLSPWRCYEASIAKLTFRDIGALRRAGDMKALSETSAAAETAAAVIPSRRRGTPRHGAGTFTIPAESLA